MPAYTGKILYVDLNSGRSEEKPLPLEQARQLIGGRGLGAWYLWQQPKGNNPLAAEAPLLFLTGPLTGLAPGGAQTCIVAKSPATNTILHSTIGGNWGPELKFAGYDGLIISGKADEPVYLHIKDGRVEIRKASPYWGLDSFQTEIQLKAALGDPLTRILCIGPAGENLVKFASIQQELFRSAARGGPGAVMGSKNLKAIAVRGSGSLRPAHPEDYYQARAEAERNLREGRSKKSRGYYLSRWGSTISQLSHSDISELNIKNYREAHWEQIDRVGGLAYERKLKVKSRSCYSCPISCMQLGIIKSGPYAGKLTNPDFDSSGTIGPGLLLNSIEETAYLSRLGDQLGMDDASLGNVTGFAMECYEKGLLTKQDLNGLDLKWGNAQAVETLWQMIARREGIGNLLAEGVKIAAQKIGGGSEQFAMHVKGLEFAGYAPQAHPDRAVQYAVGDRGGCHHYGLDLNEQNRRAWADSLTVCSWHWSFINPDLYVKLVSAATGWEYAREDWEKTAERILILSRAYNIREGMIPLQDDVLPSRVHDEPLTWGPKAGAHYDRKKFVKDRADWYAVRGCDEEGVPKADHLRELGLDYLLKSLEEERRRWVAVLEYD